MSIQSATPQETFDHMLGSGATSYSWWLSVEILTPIGPEHEVGDEWSAKLTAEDGVDEESTVTVTISHESVMEAAREILRMYLSKDEEGWPQNPHNLVRECAMLVFDAADADFDADSADCLLQLMVLGRIVFG